MAIAALIAFGIAVYLTVGSSHSTPTPTPNIRTFTGTEITEAEVAAYAQLAEPEVLARGEEIYVAECASCHGADGEGQFPEAPMQPDDTGRIGAPPHDGTGHTWHHDDDLLVRYVLEGGQAPPDQFYPMPGFEEKLSVAEAEAVIAYIKKMWSQEQRLVQAERTLMSRANR